MQNQRPHNPNPSQSVKHFKPKPVDTSSSNSGYIQPKPNFTHTELFILKIHLKASPNNIINKTLGTLITKMQNAL